MLELEKQELTKENEQLKRRKGELEGQYSKLQQQIESKFAYLEEQITLYEAEKAENVDKIRSLKEELAIRESRHYFSFSKLPGEKIEKEIQTEEDSPDLDIGVYKSSIESLLEENARLKRSILLLQSLSFDGRNLPKEVEI